MIENYGIANMRSCLWIFAHGQAIQLKMKAKRKQKESKKKVCLITEQIERAADIYHTWQAEGTDGTHYEEPEFYRSVGMAEIEKNGWSLVPSKYIDFIDHDLEIDFHAEMSRIQKEMGDILAQEKQSQKMLEDAFRGIGYGIE